MNSKMFRDQILIVILLIACVINPLSSFAENSDEDYLYVINSDSRVVINTTGHQRYSKINNRIAEELAIPEINRGYKTVPKKLLPAPFQAKIELLTLEGRSSVEIKETRVERGASEWTFQMLTDQKSSDLLFKGLAKASGPFPPTAHLRKISGIAGDDPKVLKLAASFKKWVDANIEQDQKKLYGELDVGLSDLVLAEGVFHRGGKWLVWSEFTNYQSSTDRESSFIVAAILDSEGTPIEVIQKPSVGRGDGIGSWDPIFGVDLDSDGVEELIYDSGHYEGGSIVLHHSRSGKSTSTVLWTDSA